MGFFLLFKHSKPTKKDYKQCLINIKQKVAEKSGIPRCIELDDKSVAFSGTQEDYGLYVSLSICKKRGKEYLYAYMEDYLEWYEWDYKSQAEFEDSIVEYICEKINRTIKTITETKKHKYIRVTEYLLDKESNEWTKIYDRKISWWIIRPFVDEDSIHEKIEEYNI